MYLFFNIFVVFDLRCGGVCHPQREEAWSMCELILLGYIRLGGRGASARSSLIENVRHGTTKIVYCTPLTRMPSMIYENVRHGTTKNVYCCTPLTRMPSMICWHKTGSEQMEPFFGAVIVCLQRFTAQTMRMQNLVKSPCFDERGDTAIMHQR